MASRQDSPDDAIAGDGRLHRYRLVVLAAEVGDVVESVGGFLCDRARAGWDVNVLLTEACDARPLRILGITAQTPDSDLSSTIRALSHGGALAVGADLLARDASVREDVSRMATSGLTEVTVWGRPALSEIGGPLEPADHPLSTAAKAFKAQAVLAIGGDSQNRDGLAPTETLYRLRGPASGRLHSV